MARRIPWRRLCPDVVATRIEDASQARIYLLRETGPTGFLLKEDGLDRKFKVFLGDQHSCTCQTFMKEKELCLHILWVLLKKFRVPKENQIIFQLSLVEREINEVMRGSYSRSSRAAKRRNSEKDMTASDSREKLKQKQIEEQDVCPICQDELLQKPEPITYCKYGCGNSVHIKCMKIWAEHQRSTGETIVKCPLCRVDFGSFQELMDEFHKSSRRKTRAERQDLHLGATCKRCRVCPIAGKCYRCVVCADYHLCHTCFATDTHMQHSFQFRQKPSERWRAATRITPLPNAVISDLQNRDISAGDYELLLQLDRQVTDQDGIPTQVIHSLPTQVLQERHTLLTDDTECGVCLQGFQTYQCVRTLPCQHPFHVTCIDNWLTTHSQCPIDGSYVGSLTSAASVTDPQPREHLMPGGGHFTTGSNSTPVLGGAGKRSGQRLKGLSERNDSAKSLPSSFTLSGSGLLASQNNRKLRSNESIRTPDQMITVQPPLLDQPRITIHSDHSVAQLVRLSSAGRDGTGSRQRVVPDASPGIRTYSRHNITFNPVNSSKPPMPPQNLNSNRGSSGDTRRQRAKLDRSQRSSSVGELSLFASGTAVHLGSQTPPVSTDKTLKGQLVKGKLASKNSRQSVSDPVLTVTLEPIVGSGISVFLPPVDVD